MDELVYYNATGNPEDKKNLTSFSYLSSLHSTKIYHQYRQSPSSANSSVNLSIGHGSHLLVALPEKPILHVYLHGKESPEQIIPLPEVLTCLTCYRDSENPQKPTLLLGGSVSGRLYVWSINSGLLLAVKQPHYQPLTYIAAYSGFIATGSKDSRIVIHTLNTIFMNANVNDTDTNDRPFATITDNTLPITSLVFNRGLNNDVKLMSSSLDSTVRIYSLAAASKAELLTTIVATGPVTALATDPAFRALYLGLADGQIRSVPLFKVNPKTKVIEAVGGMGKIVTLKPDVDNLETFTCHQDQHKPATDVSVTQLKVSFDGTLLVSGDSKGSLFVIDITTKQVRKKLKDLVGEISTIELWTADLADGRFENTGVDKNLKRTIPVLKRSIAEPADLSGEKLTLKLTAKPETTATTTTASPWDFDSWIDQAQSEEKVFANLSAVDSHTLGNTGFSLNIDKNTIRDLKKELQDKDSTYAELKSKYDELLSEYTAALSK